MITISEDNRAINSVFLVRRREKKLSKEEREREEHQLVPLKMIVVIDTDQKLSQMTKFFDVNICN